MKDELKEVKKEGRKDRWGKKKQEEKKGEDGQKEERLMEGRRERRMKWRKNIMKKEGRMEGSNEGKENSEE